MKNSVKPRTRAEMAQTMAYQAIYINFMPFSVNFSYYGLMLIIFIVLVMNVHNVHNVYNGHNVHNVHTGSKVHNVHRVLVVYVMLY